MSCADAAARLGLDGPHQRASDLPLAVAAYTGSGVTYEIVLGLWDGHVEIHACRETESTVCKVSVEKLAVAAGAVDGRGGVSFGARGLRQLRKSLAGQVRYVELVHPLVSGDADAAIELMRGAGAREWSKPALR